MKILKSFLVGFFLWSTGNALATEFFMLNKTGKRLYYKLYYLTFGQTILPFITPTTSNQKVSDWFNEHLDDKIKEGWLAKDAVLHVKSYRLIALELQEKKDGKSLVQSLAGDPRILAACQQRKKSDCIGNMLRGLRPSIRYGVLYINQDWIRNIARPVVIAVTLDPVKERKGKTGYIITELAHTWGLIRRPKPFFYEVQGIPTLTN